MDSYIQYQINVAVHGRINNGDSYEDWREKEWNSEKLHEIPDDFDLDWCEVMNYIAHYEEDWLGDQVKFDFPINKKVIYNKFNYMILIVNEDKICDSNEEQDWLCEIARIDLETKSESESE